jgi:hypothetical protein
VFLSHLHDRLKMRRLVRSIEPLDHTHPYQPKTKIDRCQDKSRLVDKALDRVSG